MKLWIPALLASALLTAAAPAPAAACMACPEGQVLVCQGEGATKVCWCQKPLAPGCGVFICPS
jgi:hypothetical protein